MIPTEWDGLPHTKPAVGKATLQRPTALAPDLR